MDNAISVNLSPLQVLLTLAFQLWIVIFPILIIRKLNYMIALLQDKSDHREEAS